MMEMNDNDETNQDLTIITEKQKENFRNRMSMLILEKFTPAIKVVFDKEIHPDELGKMVNKNLEKLLKLRGRNILTPTQWNKLRPKKGSMPLSSNTFDGTLMICLLKHLLGEKISDRLPLPTDFSRNADLSRLLHYRNKICHFDDQFDYSNSVAALDDCIQAIQRLSGMDCNDYKTKLFGDCSKDCRVIIAALIFLYREGCDLGTIGLSCAFWELTHVEKMGALLLLCVYYKLLDPVVSSLWKDLTEGKGKQFGVLDEFVKEIFNGNSTVEVPKWEDLPSSTITDAYKERRNSYLLCLAAMGIKRCTFNNRETENEDDHIYDSLTQTCNNNDSSITDSALATQGGSSYSFVDLLSSFSLRNLLTNARNYLYSFYDPENVSHSSIAITNESVWNNSSSNGTDLACYTGSGNDTGSCMIM